MSQFALGMWIIPVHDHAPAVKEAFNVATREADWTGFNAVANQWVTNEEVFLCLLESSEARLVRAGIRSHLDLGVGWFLLDLEVRDQVGRDEYPELQRFAQRLVTQDADGQARDVLPRPGSPSGSAPQKGNGPWATPT